MIKYHNFARLLFIWKFFQFNSIHLNEYRKINAKKTVFYYHNEYAVGQWSSENDENDESFWLFVWNRSSVTAYRHIRINGRFASLHPFLLLISLLLASSEIIYILLLLFVRWYFCFETIHFNWIWCVHDCHWTLNKITTLLR